MSVVSRRKARAHNEYLSSYDLGKPSRYITYPDVNYFYSWSMIRYLPYNGYKWIGPGCSF